MTLYERKPLNCSHRKILLTAKDFPPTTLINKPVVICLDCKAYELVELL